MGRKNPNKSVRGNSSVSNVLNSSVRVSHQLFLEHDNSQSYVTLIESKRNKSSEGSKLAKMNASANRLSAFLAETCTPPRNGAVIHGPSKYDHSSPYDPFNLEESPASVIRSIEMHTVLQEYFERNIGRGVWNDAVTSNLAQCLNFNLVFGSPKTKHTAKTLVSCREEKKNANGSRVGDVEGFKYNCTHVSGFSFLYDQC